MKWNILLLTLQPSSISSAGQTVRSRLSVGSGASRRLIVPLVRAVSFIDMLAFTEMWLKPNRDETSGGKKTQVFVIFYYRLIQIIPRV